MFFVKYLAPDKDVGCTGWQLKKEEESHSRKTWGLGVHFRPDISWVCPLPGTVWDNLDTFSDVILMVNLQIRYIVPVVKTKFGNHVIYHPNWDIWGSESDNIMLVCWKWQYYVGTTGITWDFPSQIGMCDQFNVIWDQRRLSDLSWELGTRLLPSVSKLLSYIRLSSKERRLGGRGLKGKMKETCVFAFCVL